MNCEQCQGVCILTEEFYDKAANSKKFKDMFDPKYHKVLVKELQKAGIAPETNGVWRPFEDFVAASEEADAKKLQIETLGYDPESTEFLSKKMKAKVKKLAKRDEEQKLSEEEWVTQEYGKKEFKDDLKLFAKRWKLNIEGVDKDNIQHRHEEVGYRRRKKSRFLVVGNNIKGTLPVHEPDRYNVQSNRPNHRKNKLAIMEFATKDFVLETEEYQESEILQRLLAAN